MRRTVLLTVWILTDIVLFLGAYTLAYLIRVQFVLSTDLPIAMYLRTVALVIPFWLGVMVSLRIFTLTRIQTSWKNILHIAFSSVMGLAFFTLAFYFLNNKETISRLLLIYAGLLSFIFTVMWHVIFDAWQRKMLRKGPTYRLLIVGTNRDTEKVIKLLEERESVFKPVAILESRGTADKEIGGIPVLGRLHKLEEVIKDKGITHLLQADDLEHSVNLLSLCRQHKITYLLLPSVLGIVGFDQRIDSMEGQPVIVVDG